jgi:hypothetical protein
LEDSISLTGEEEAGGISLGGGVEAQETTATTKPKINKREKKRFTQFDSI